MSVPFKAVARLGLVLGQAKRRGRKYITLETEHAQALHDYIKVIRNIEYMKSYRKL